MLKIEAADARGKSQPGAARRASWMCAQAAEISAESETSAKSLERRGCVIANLKCTDAQLLLQFSTPVAWCDRNAAVQSSVLNF